MSEISIEEFKRSLELSAFIHRDDEKFKEYLLGLINTLENLDEWCFDPLTVHMTPDCLIWPSDLRHSDIPLYDRELYNLHNRDVNILRRSYPILFDFDDGLRRILSQLSFPNHTFKDYSWRSILITYDNNRRPACYLLLGDCINRAKKYLKINDYFSVTIPDDYKKYIYDLHQDGISNPEREIPITIGSKKENKSDFSVLLDTNFSTMTYDEIVLFVKYWRDGDININDHWKVDDVKSILGVGNCYIKNIDDENHDIDFGLRRYGDDEEKSININALINHMKYYN